ncbi:MAG: DUF3883 domain-containing protein [Bacteroidetes bacterium]|nr:DUF3883 domain-containing protein [Bacteroidota bacterium]
MGKGTILSSGNIVALWQIILLAKKYPILHVKTAVGTLTSTSILGGSLPFDGGLKIGNKYNFLEIKSGNIVLMESSINKLIPLCEEDFPNKSVTRAILEIVLKNENFDWLIYFDEDPDIFKVGIPNEWIDLLENASLFNFSDDQVTAWWNKVFSRYTSYKEGNNAKVGKVAEQICFNHETKRLSTFFEDGKYSIPVKWASMISDKFGFDILSIRGNELKHSFIEKDKIRIEVKSSTFKDETKFRFYVTRNEWEKAIENLDDYFFYCWTSVSLEKQSALGPYIISANQLESLIPIDVNPNICSWSECRFIVDLSTIKINL